MRALLAKHNIRLAASHLDSDTATGLLDALVLPGTYAARLASQRRLMLVLADEIASVEVELHARLRSLTRRDARERPVVLQCGDLSLDPVSRLV